MDNTEIANKTMRSLIIIGIIFCLILVKIWHLTVIKKEEKIAESKLPQNKAILQYANRGTICDRFGIPLALNRIRYNACIYYAQIRQIPSVKWVTINGKKQKVFERKQHIEKLSALLAKELNLDPGRIEDLIHSKASLLPHVPFVIKENISEKEYYKLRMLERNWMGLHAEISAERFYPSEKTASNIIGYLGAITQKEYLSIANEIKALELLIEEEKNNEQPLLPPRFKNFEEVENRLFELKEKAYSVNDLIGKNGLEGKFEENLRGFHGKKVFAIDIKGNLLKELPNSKEPIPGEKLKTNISLELQSFAESLLAQDEKWRDGKSTIYNKQNKVVEEQKQPLLKGGAIVVLDPLTGEVLTLATYPRFDPNDFISSFNKKIKQKKQLNIYKWLEHPIEIARIYDGKDSLKRELFSSKVGFYEEEKKLSFNYFLKLMLPRSSPLFASIESIKTIKNAISLQEDFETLLYYAKADAYKLASFFDDPDSELLKNEEFEKKASILKNKISPYFRNLSIEEKVFLVDICRILVHSPSFSNDLINLVGSQSLELYWETSKSALILEDYLQDMIRPLFKSQVFLAWRKEHQKDFLRQKREEESEKKLFPRPYLDYLDSMENELFQDFWQKHRLIFLTSFIKNADFADPSLKVFGDFLKNKKEKKDPSKKWVRSLLALEKDLQDLTFDQTYEFLKTIRSFNSLDRPLYGKYNIKKPSLEKDLAASFYPSQGFGYTRSQAYRQSAPLGSIFKVAVAYGALKKHYESLSSKGKISDKLNPLTMTDRVCFEKDKNETKQVVGFSEDHRPYYRCYKGGKLPRSAHHDVGKIDITQALAQSSNPYFAILAADFLNANELLEVAKDFGFGSKTNIDLPYEITGYLPEDLETNRTGLYSFAIGQHSLITTPLQAAVMLSSIANKGEVLKPQILSSKKEVIRTIFLPDPVRNTILTGLDQTIWSEKGSARPDIVKKLKNNTQLMEKYTDLKHQLVGKTSTAEIMYKSDLFSKAEKYNHIWFGGISFEKEEIGKWENPELVVVVYLRFGDTGREAAPLAAEIVHKYRELKDKYSK